MLTTGGCACVGWLYLGFGQGGIVSRSIVGPAPESLISSRTVWEAGPPFCWIRVGENVESNAKCLSTLSSIFGDVLGVFCTFGPAFSWLEYFNILHDWYLDTPGAYLYLAWRRPKMDHKVEDVFLPWWTIFGHFGLSGSLGKIWKTWGMIWETSGSSCWNQNGENVNKNIRKFS